MIQSKLNGLTLTEKKIAEYILDNYHDFINYTVTELAEKIDVSEASIVRFCRSIGYRGYQDFKIKAARDVIQPELQLKSIISPGDDTATICKKIFESEQRALADTLALMDMETLERASQAIANADKIQIFGNGGSQLVGKDAQHKFLKIGIHMEVHTDTDLQMMHAALMSKNDVAIGISHSGSNPRVIHCMQLAKKNGATAIALTTRGRSPLSLLADIVLFVETEETVFKSESTSARIAQLAVIDSLAAAVAFKNYNRAYDAVQKTREATSQGKY